MRVVLAGLVASALVLNPVVLLAHLKLLRSAPAEGALLTAPPAEIRLWFNQDPLLPMSAMTLSGPSGEVKLGPVRGGPDRSLVATVPRLDRGSYRLDWRTAGDDGHVIRGRVTFEVRPPANIRP